MMRDMAGTRIDQSTRSNLATKYRIGGQRPWRGIAMAAGVWGSGWSPASKLSPPQPPVSSAPRPVKRSRSWCNPRPGPRRSKHAASPITNGRIHAVFEHVPVGRYDVLPERSRIWNRTPAWFPSAPIRACKRSSTASLAPRIIGRSFGHRRHQRGDLAVEHLYHPRSSISLWDVRSLFPTRCILFAKPWKRPGSSSS
jgi:hypothetical protein